MFQVKERGNNMEWLGIILNGLTIAFVMWVSYTIGNRIGYSNGYKEGLDMGWRLGAYFGYEKEK